MKTKHPVEIMVFRVVTCVDDVVFPFIFPHWLRLEGLHKMPGGGSAGLD